MQEFGEYAGITGLIISLAATLPKLLAVLTRRRQVDVTSEISRFEAILKAQDGQLEDAEGEIKECQDSLKAEKSDRIREREYFFRQVAACNARVNECEGILRRMGWKEQRKARRTGTEDYHP